MRYTKKIKFWHKINKKTSPKFVCIFFFIYDMQAGILVKFWPIILHCYTCMYIKIQNFSSRKNLFFLTSKNRAQFARAQMAIFSIIRTITQFITTKTVILFTRRIRFRKLNILTLFMNWLKTIQIFILFCEKTSDIFINCYGSTKNIINNKNYIQVRRSSSDNYKNWSERKARRRHRSRI